MKGLIIILIIIGVINILKNSKNNKNIHSEDVKDQALLNEEVLPYKRKMLLTKAEYSIWNLLKAKCDKYEMIICPKIRMEDFINVDIKDYSKRQSYRGRIKSRHVDFLICDKKLNILAGIEIDDNSHLKESSKEIDEFKNRVFKTINIPLFRIVLNEGYYEKQIDNYLRELGYYEEEIKKDVFNNEK